MLVLSIAFWAFLLQSVYMGIGLVLMITVHEVGHMIAARSRGLAVSLPEFSPLGASVQVEGARNAAEEAYVKLAGPLVGGLAGILAMALGLVFSIPDLFEVGRMAVFLNLFNLIPLDPLDGGAVANSLSRHFWVVGAAIFACVSYWLAQLNPVNIMFIFFIGLQAVELVGARMRMWQATPRYFAVSGGKKFVIAISYAAIAGALFAVAMQPHLVRQLLVVLGL